MTIQEIYSAWSLSLSKGRNVNKYRRKPRPTFPDLIRSFLITPISTVSSQCVRNVNVNQKKIVPLAVLYACYVLFKGTVILSAGIRYMYICSCYFKSTAFAIFMFYIVSVKNVNLIIQNDKSRVLFPYPL